MAGHVSLSTLSVSSDPIRTQPRTSNVSSPEQPRTMLTTSESSSLDPCGFEKSGSVSLLLGDVFETNVSTI